MQSENLVPCAHKKCRCIVEVEDQFCSPACAAAKGKPLSKCTCGHPECAESEEVATRHQPNARSRVRSDVVLEFGLNGTDKTELVSKGKYSLRRQTLFF
jgi:hypothetical protein